MSLATGCTNSKKLIGHIPGMENKMHYVCRWQGDRMELIDSVSTDSKGDFSVKLPGNLRGVIMVTRKSEFGFKSDINDPINTQTIFLLSDNTDIEFKAYWGYYSENLKVTSGSEAYEKSRVISKITTPLSRRYHEIRQRLIGFPEDSIMNNNLVADYRFQYKKMEEEAEKLFENISEKSALRTYYSLMKPPYIESVRQPGSLFSGIRYDDDNILNFPEFYYRFKYAFKEEKPDKNNQDSLLSVLKPSPKNRKGLQEIINNIN